MGSWLPYTSWRAGESVRGYPSFHTCSFVYSSSSLVLIATSLVPGIGFQPSGDLRWELLLFLGLGLISTILGHTMYTWSLKYVRAPVVSTSLLGEPVGATLLALLFLAEAPSATDLLGGFVALLSIYLTARGTKGYGG
ncbi:MAG: EamA family transporter [Thermoplasmata archaeon]